MIELLVKAKQIREEHDAQGKPLDLGRIGQDAPIPGSTGHGAGAMTAGT